MRWTWNVSCMINVHITDDHKMLVEGLAASINESGIATVVGVSYTLSECRKALQSTSVDVLLLDISLPDGSGVDFCEEVIRRYPEMKVLILTSHNEYSIAKRVMENGASGYILKNALSEEVTAGIEAVMNGEIFLCDEIDILIRKKNEQQIWLTSREQELLRLIVDGHTNQEMAEKLYLSIETIKTYRKNLILKLGAKNSMILVKMAIENKLI
ncbi:response regulator transcription factor [Parabacteroides sp. PF5-9]|uniref:response regulator transcription factor n=1 Tax=Parabacteroides sp. PF5-9 TaxID=1742404 RepID=UPI0024756D47|nr:response regulator transcription factor [Parabacteroides sp. PF5-9]MDH6358627.1 DNA-binding NarL/FixJ family response regulator [Parabacteroides sp. PF5-9]